MQTMSVRLNRLVNSLATSRLFTWLAGHVLVPYWAWKTPVYPQHGGARATVQPGDNMQRMMNLILPLKDKTAIGRAQAAMAIASNLDEIYAGLDNVGTVHFARFLIVVFHQSSAEHRRPLNRRVDHARYPGVHAKRADGTWGEWSLVQVQRLLRRIDRGPAPRVRS